MCIPQLRQVFSLQFHPEVVKQLVQFNQLLGKDRVLKEVVLWILVVKSIRKSHQFATSDQM